MQPSTDRIRNFLQYLAVKLIDNPAQAQMKVAELSPTKARFKLILAKNDVSSLIGRNGYTVSAIRNVLNAATEKYKIQVILKILTQEEEEQSNNTDHKK